MALIKIKRGTRAQIDAAAIASELVAGEPYLVSDEGRVGVATAATTWVPCARQDDVPTSASQVEMETGTEPALRLMSPLRVAQAVSTEPLRSGYAFTAHRNNVSGAYIHGGVSQPVPVSGVLTANQLRAIPFVIGVSCIIDALLLEVVTTGGAGNIIAGLYKPLSQANIVTLGATKVVDTDVVSLASTGVKTVVLGSPVAVTPGIYLSVHLGDNGTPTCRQMASASIAAVFGMTVSAPFTVNTGLTLPYTYAGTLPSTLPAMTTGAQINPLALVARIQ